MISQTVNQGTVGPTHYIILQNNITALTKERLYMITHKLCHLYYNWQVSFQYILFQQIMQAAKSGLVIAVQ